VKNIKIVTYNKVARQTVALNVETYELQTMDLVGIIIIFYSDE
jgi:hypothetical protein